MKPGVPALCPLCLWLRLHLFRGKQLWAVKATWRAEEVHWALVTLSSSCAQVPDGATVALVPRLTKHIPRENQDYIPGESESWADSELPLAVSITVPGKLRLLSLAIASRHRACL